MILLQAFASGTAHQNLSGCKFVDTIKVPSRFFFNFLLPQMTHVLGQNFLPILTFK